MKTHCLRLAIGVTVALLSSIAIAQHEQHQPGAQPASAELMQCVRVQPSIDNIVAAAMARLESARQSNDPSEMRGAVDHLQSALRDIRAQLEPCKAAAAAADPHAGHAMPSTKPPTGTVAPAPPPQTPPGAADPHASHTATPAKPAPAKPTVTTAESKPKPKPPAATADPHAGHSGTAAKPADPGPKGASPASKAPPSTKRSAPSDPHASHGTTAKPETDVKDGKVMDPVTGLMVDPATAPKAAYQGHTYYFSSEQSRKEFLANPAKFAKKPKG
jgi:YHS domain-containing protein